MTDYPWIRKWGAMLGSHRDYINEQVEKARNDSAPENAIYKGGQYVNGKYVEGRWVTTDDVTSPTARFHLGLDSEDEINTEEVNQ